MNEPRVLHSRPMEIEALQWTGKNWPAMTKMFRSKVDQLPSGGLVAQTGREGDTCWLPVRLGYWVARQIDDNSVLWRFTERDIEDHWCVGWPDQRTQLRDALTEGRARLYHNNQFFYSHVNNLANTLPVWVDGLATSAEKEAANLELIKLAHERMPIIPAFWEYPGESNE